MHAFLKKQRPWFRPAVKVTAGGHLRREKGHQRTRRLPSFHPEPGVIDQGSSTLV